MYYNHVHNRAYGVNIIINNNVLSIVSIWSFKTLIQYIMYIECEYNIHIYLHS